MERRVHDGVIYEGSDADGWTVVGYADGPAQAPQPIVVGAPDPMRQLEADYKRAQIRKMSDGPAPDPNADLKRALIQAQLEKTRADTAKAATKANAKPLDPTKIAAISALEQQIAQAERLHERGFKGGMPNWLNNWVPESMNPEIAAFNAAGGGLQNPFMAAFRVPGSGNQSDADLRAFIDANQPTATDSDAAIQQKLWNIRTRLSTLKEAHGLAQPALQQGQERDPSIPSFATSGGDAASPAPPAAPVAPNGPVILPQAKGAHGDQGVDLRTASGGKSQVVAIPQLSHVPQLVQKWVRQGESATTIRTRLNEIYKPYGASVQPELYAAIASTIRAHKMNPNKPLGSLMSGWDSFGMVNKQGVLDSGPLGKMSNTSAGAGVIAAADALALGNLGRVTGKEAAMDVLAQERPTATMVGDIAGTGLGMYGFNRAIGATGTFGQRFANLGGGAATDAIWGGARGASENPDNPLGGAAVGGIAAGSGTVMGNALAGGVSRGLKGVGGKSVRYLTDRGIPLTMGETLGSKGWVGKLMNAAESNPFVGHAFTARRMEGREAFANSAIDEAVANIGKRAPDLGDIPARIGDAQDIVSGAYDDTFKGAFVRPDSRLVDDVSGIRVAGLTPDQDQVWRATVTDALMSRYDKAAKGFGPEALQDSLSNLSEAAAQYGREGTRASYLQSQGVRQAREALLAAAERQNPNISSNLARANDAYGRLKIVENASLAAMNGSAGHGAFTPAQLGAAMKVNTARFGGKAKAARGDMPFAELQRHGQAVMGNALPNSGTADRLFANSLLMPGVLGASAIGANQTGLESAAIPLGLLAAASTKTGGRVLQNAMVKRTAGMKQVGRKIAKNKRKVGLAASPVVLYATGGD